MGALATELVESRRRARDTARHELRSLQTDVQAAHEQSLLAATQLLALNQRVNDVLDRLNRERQTDSDRVTGVIERMDRDDRPSRETS